MSAYHAPKPSRFYYPLDQMLDTPNVRVLRALRHFEQATAFELAVALDEIGNQRALCRVLSRLRADRMICAAGDKPQRYRITARGERRLRELLHRGELVQ